MTLASIIAAALVVVVPQWQYMIGNLCWLQITWTYDPRTNTVYVCEWEDEFNTLHEIGHQFWHTKMREVDKISYTKKYNETKVFYRGYSQYSVEEDFADSFALYAQWKMYTKRILSIRHYIKMAQ